MSLTESKVVSGLLVISLGLTLLLKELTTIHDSFGLFVGIFFSLFGLVLIALKSHTRKHETLGLLITLFFGLSLLALEFYILPFTTLNFFFLLFLSVGLGYLLFGSIIRFSTRSIWTGIGFIVIALLIFLPKALAIEDIFWVTVKRYIVPIILILVGLFILLPIRRKE